MENNNLTPNEIFLLGFSYEKQCDYNKAIDYYKKAANNGNIDAISHLGDLSTWVQLYKKTIKKLINGILNYLKW